MMKRQTEFVILVMCLVFLLVGCAAASAVSNDETQLSVEESKNGITLGDLWNDSLQEFSLPGLPMDSNAKDVMDYFQMDHVPMYMGPGTAQPEMLATLSVDGITVTAILDTQWRDGALFMESLNFDLTENQTLDEAAKAIVSKLTALYGEPVTDTEMERDGITTTQEYIWRSQSTNELDTRLSLWVASKDGSVTVIQISCDKPNRG